MTTPSEHRGAVARRGRLGGRAHWVARFPFGPAPFWLLVLTLAAGALRLAVGRQSAEDKPDLVLAIFASNHKEMYERAIPAFEARHGVRVRVQLVSGQVLTSRLQAALMTGADVPDLVEIMNTSIGLFTRGPLEDVGFVDLTDRLHAEGLYPRIVESRYSQWSSRERIFALPHDVHPVMLAYRRDLVEALGIDVNTLTTWEAFARVGREVTRDLDGDGHPDRYMIDLPEAGHQGLPIILLQAGETVLDPSGRVRFDTPKVAEIMAWYVRQIAGPGRIGYEAGWGQTFAKAVTDGLVLFFVCPDWRSKQVEMDLPHLRGKLALMPLPAWEAGGRRTSCWGGTGLAITKSCPRQELAWAFAKYLYLDEAELGERFRLSNMLPPLKDAWDLPEFDAPNAFYSGQPIGRLYAELAPEVPPDFNGAYFSIALAKLTGSSINVLARYRQRGDEGLEAFALEDLRRGADYVRRLQARDAFARGTAAAPAGKEARHADHW